MNQEEKDFFAVVESLMPDTLRMAPSYSRSEYVTMILMFGAGMRCTIEGMTDPRDVPAAFELFEVYIKLFGPFSGMELPSTVAEIFSCELSSSADALNKVLSHVDLNYNSDGKVTTADGTVIADFNKEISNDDK